MPHPLPNADAAKGRILIVDDEPGVVSAIEEALAPLGFSISTTTDPHQALRLLTADDSIDLLITDLFMPSMDGATLLECGRRIRPNLRAVLTTGLASDLEIRRWRRQGEVIVTKPWLEEDFMGAVERALRR